MGNGKKRKGSCLITTISTSEKGMPDRLSRQKRKGKGKERKLSTHAAFFGVFDLEKCITSRCARKKRSDWQGKGWYFRGRDQVEAMTAKDGTAGMSRRSRNRSGSVQPSIPRQSSVPDHECRERKPICIEANQTLYNNNRRTLGIVSSTKGILKRHLCDMCKRGRSGTVICGILTYEPMVATCIVQDRLAFDVFDQKEN